MKLVVAGGSGFIGQALLQRLVNEEHEVTLLTRNSSEAGRQINPAVEIVQWDALSVGSWSSKVNGADAVLNFAGEPIAGRRWTATQKEKITRSRIDATRAIVSAIRQAEKKPSVLVNASAVGYYGSVEEGHVTETRGPGVGFLSQVCSLWESEARTAESLGVRVAMLRIGVVLGDGGGALEKMLLPFKIFVGGPIGSGKQWFPWVHRDDVIGAILYTLATPNLSGPINMTAPEVVSMKDFCSALGEVLNRPSWAPVPGFVLKIMLGEMAEMLLTGQRVVPSKLQQHGFHFKYPNLIPALNNILR